jgi:hypothetical protein
MSHAPETRGSWMREVTPNDPRWKWVAAGAVLLVLLIVYIVMRIPFEITVAPEWRVHVADELGRPVPVAVVREEWKHEAFDDVIHMQDALTNEAGIAEFPRRTIRTNLWERNRECRRRKGDAPCGVQARVFTFKCSYGASRFDDRHIAVFPGEVEKLESKLVLRRCKPVDFEFGCFPHPAYGTPRCRE